MHPFRYSRAATLPEVFAGEHTLLAGGTDIYNLVKEGIETPDVVLDITGLELGGISVSNDVLRIGALARLADVARNPDVRNHLPALAQAIEASASPQLRHMATIAGNLLQQTRCPYFRAETFLPCNRRSMHSGCSARNGEDRTHAIFGWNENCVATHPSDPAVALTALDAVITIASVLGERQVPLDQFLLLPGENAVAVSVLRRGELITAIDIPMRRSARSAYVKVRERASYEFALVSAAAVVGEERPGDQTVSIALGGVAARPWRLPIDSKHQRFALSEEKAVRTLIEPLFAEARPGHLNGFKIELALRAATRAVLSCG